VEKIAQSVAQHVFVILNTLLVSWEKVTQEFVLFLSENLPKENNGPLSLAY
jgi:hypothetical protein